MTPEHAQVVVSIDALRNLKAAIEKQTKASEARRALPPGSSRTRVTTANARWHTAAEATERARRIAASALTDLLQEFGCIDAAMALRDAFAVELDNDGEEVRHA